MEKVTAHSDPARILLLPSADDGAVRDPGNGGQIQRSSLVHGSNHRFSVSFWNIFSEMFGEDLPHDASPIVLRKAT